MTEQIIDVVSPVLLGKPGQKSSYLLIPVKLKEKRKITNASSFAVIEAENGDIIYRKQGA